MSVRTSTSLALRACSGDMYMGEPITPPVRVSCLGLRAGAIAGARALGDAEIANLDDYSARAGPAAGTGWRA